MNSLVSIIIPVYNVQDYLARCLESVLAQTYNQIEVILVDDGSTDNSSIICDNYEKKDSRVHVIHQKNAGQSVARNRALDQVKGEYISFIDSDDYVSPRFIEELVALIKRDDSDIAVCNYYIVLQDRVVQHEYNGIVGVLSSNSFWKLESSNYMLCAALWNKLFKAELWKELRFMVGKYAEDSFAMTHYVTRANRISVIDETLYYYFQRPNSLVHKFSVKNLDAVEARLKRIELHREKEFLEVNRAILLNSLRIMIRAYDELDIRDLNVKQRYSFLRAEFVKAFHLCYPKYEISSCYFQCALYSLSDFLYSRILNFATKIMS